MGLDMYLQGEKFFWGNWENPRTEDGIKVSKVEVELAYWRKHPNLHGYIVQTFAEGVDQCQKIPLNKEKLQRIIEAVKERKLPHTTGFFFGSSSGSYEEQNEDIKALTKAIEWLETKEPNVSRSVFYEASW